MLVLILIGLFLSMALWALLPAATVMVRTGLLVSGALPTASSLSDTFANNGKQYLLVRNADSGAHVLTFDTPLQIDGLTVQNPTVSIGAGETKLIGPFKPTTFNDGNQLVTVTTDVITQQTVQVLQADTVVGQ